MLSACGGIRQGHNPPMARPCWNSGSRPRSSSGFITFFSKKMLTSDEGTAPTQAISLTGVRSDLLQIAQAERGYIATNAIAPRWTSSSPQIPVSVPQRARRLHVFCRMLWRQFHGHRAARACAAGSPIRYPSLASTQQCKFTKSMTSGEHRRLQAEQDGEFSLNSGTFPACPRTYG